MNAPENMAFLPDIQSQVDSRDLRIDAVGITSVRYPITIRAGNRPLPTIATVSMTVGLSAVKKGAHMSRFIELLEARTEVLDQQGFKAILFNMLERLNARSGAIAMRFPYFVRKTAPVSGMQSQLDYEVCWRGSVSEGGGTRSGCTYQCRQRICAPVPNRFRLTAPIVNARISASRSSLRMKWRSKN
jgi:GTP cyclohydrolase IB